MKRNQKKMIPETKYFRKSGLTLRAWLFFLALFMVSSHGFANEKTVIVNPKDKIRETTDMNLPLAQQQQITVQGNVSDKDGLPLPGVNVLIKGTIQGTVTDLDGNFEIDVPSNESILVFSFIGYLPEEITVGDQKIIDVTLASDLMALDEVVVVGYGTVKKVNLTGSVDNVTGSVLTKRPATNSANLLQGRLTGVDVIQPTAEPGKDNPTIRIRGKGSYGGSNDPLVLIDGVSGSLDNISPNDIESVSVLKDAASASIYGARAANGVILVTTKKGKKGAPVISYSGNYSIQSPTALPENITNSAEYMEMFNKAREHGASAFSYNLDEIENYRNPPEGREGEYPNFDPIDYWFRNATVHNHNLSVAGGSENSTYNTSFTYLNQDAMIPGYRFKRYTGLVNYATELKKWLTLGTIVNITHKDDQKPAKNGLFMPLLIYTANPLNEPYLPDGSGGVVTRAYTGESRQQNPAEVYLMGDLISKENNLNGQAYVDIKPFKGLTWTTKLAVNYTDRFMKMHQQPYDVYQLHSTSLTPGFHPRSAGIPDILGLTDDYTKNISPMLNSVITFQTKFRENHDFGALAGYEQISYKHQQLRLRRTSTVSPALTEIDGYSPSGQEANLEYTRFGDYDGPEEWAMQSFFGRVNYGFKNKYLLEANIRYDGTSKVSPDYRWGLFPSVSAGWVVSEEDFLKNNVDWLSHLKLRASYGVLGNQDVGTYLYQDNLPINLNYAFTETRLSQGGMVDIFKDQSLRWESTSITDIGLDLNIKNGLFEASFDWFDKNTYDILAEQPIPASMGLEEPTLNDGDMRNYGIEVELSHRHHIGQLYYDAYFQISKFTNELVSIRTPDEDGSTIKRVGLPYDSYNLYVWDGIFQIADTASGNYPVHMNNLNPNAGDLKMKDLDGNDTINNDDRQVISGAYPDFTYSFGLNLNYKRWGLSIFFQGVQGQKSWTRWWGTNNLFNSGIPPTTKWRDAWTPENPTNDLPALFIDGYPGVASYYESTFFLQDASYLRLKNVMLSYSFPDILLDRIKFKELTLYVSGENLLTFTKFEYQDPERPSSSVFAVFPQARIINFGLNVKF